MHRLMIFNKVGNFLFLLFIYFLEREGKKKRSKGEEERGRERGSVNGNIALF